MSEKTDGAIYRAPTEIAPATALLCDGSVLKGLLHLHADASAPGGFESVQHLLDDAESFFAMTQDSGRVALVGKQQVVTVRSDRPTEEALPGTTTLEMEIQLSTGVTLNGRANWSAPPAHARAIDFLNESPGFLCLNTKEGPVYINTTHIRAAYPVE